MERWDGSSYGEEVWQEGTTLSDDTDGIVEVA